MSDYFVSEKINIAAVNRYFSKCQEHNSDIHTLQIWKDNELLVRIAPDPYRCEDKCELYSLSKSFVSTAFGIAYDHGLISPDMRVIDVFPESVPENYDEKINRLTFSHVLSMNSGHASCVMPRIWNTSDPVKAFLSQPFAYEPGTHFTYNTGCSCLVAAAIKKVTGMNAMDYLQTYFFGPLGLKDIRWNCIPSGINEGGIGVQASSDDIAMLGLLYLNGGVWKGKRILSEDWVKKATTFHSDNSSNGSPDWVSGYGYQFWINSREGFRGDGAAGQLCVIVPERNLVMCVQGKVANMQTEMDDLYHFSYDMFSEKERDVLGNFDILPEVYSQPSVVLKDTDWICDPNPMGFTSLHIYETGDQIDALFIKENGDFTKISAGKNIWVRSEFTAPGLCPKLIGYMDSHLNERQVWSSCAYSEQGVLKFLSRMNSTPRTVHVSFVPNGNAHLDVGFDCENSIEKDCRLVTCTKID